MGSYVGLGEGSAVGLGDGSGVGLGEGAKVAFRLGLAVCAPIEVIFFRKMKRKAMLRQIWSGFMVQSCYQSMRSNYCFYCDV